MAEFYNKTNRGIKISIPLVLVSISLSYPLSVIFIFLGYPPDIIQLFILDPNQHRMNINAD